MYATLIMIIYWMTETLPLPVTSLLPVVLFPLLGILGTDETCQMYMKQTIMMFMGGIIMALAIEYCNLHKRIALRVIVSVGCSQRSLNFGLLLVTMFVSMWISNTATVAMMCPVVKAVLEELEEQGLCQMFVQGVDSIVLPKNHTNEHIKPSNITICYYMGIAYAASIGGCGSLFGSGTNLAFKEIYESHFPNEGFVDFPRFMIFNVPGMLLGMFLIWVYLQVVYMGMFRPNSSAAKNSQISLEGQVIARSVIVARYEELGPMSSHEISVAVLFVLSIGVFSTRQPGFVTGWADLLSEVKIHDASPTVLFVILLFLLPDNWKWLNYFRKQSSGKGNVIKLPSNPTPGLISWEYIAEKTPWSLIFMLGGGFALAEGARVSGMTTMISESLTSLKDLPLLLVLLLACSIAEVLTEFASNIAVSSVLLPILAEMSLAFEIHPMYLMLPSAIAISHAFILPVGTPAIAIVSGMGHIGMKDLLKAGLGAKIIALLILWIAFPLWGPCVYSEIEIFPEWAILLTNSSVV
ncbi:protein I'm not dead yet-like [Topomyia yanbarensis]|uniref:protein I'm not dead yet-like n=1 Tax=Topomyia yanbarensis TaxID=2498891 RepID=UPI00273AE45C|nr:protein I'm not dead yet-like [Topomyia yanbarensis]